MKFCSTRDSGLSLPLSDVLFNPRAGDGGLFMPREDINLRQYLYLMDESTSFPELVRILGMEILKDDLSPGLMKRLSDTAALLAPKLNTLDSAITLLELFHGPTSTFQDFSMSFLAALMSELKPKGKRIRILIPTTGDSGAAAAHAFGNEKDFDIVLLCPKDGIRGLPRNHLRSHGGNASILSVSGGFKECLDLATRAFSTPALIDGQGLVAATTLNPGRLIAQVFHYFFGFINLKKKAGDFYFDVPSGNYGNFSSGLLAWKWGMPVSGFISASPGASVLKGKKKNTEEREPVNGSALDDYLSNKAEKPKNGKMPDFSDVANPENYERIKSMSAGNPAVIRSIIHPAYVSREQAEEAMRIAYAEHGVLMDPFTAMGFAAARRMQRDLIEETGQIVLLSTAHPWKYADEVEKACGKRPDPPAEQARFESGHDAITIDTQPDAEIAPDLGQLEAFLKKL
jgi:threonine synthase